VSLLGLEVADLPLGGLACPGRRACWAGHIRRAAGLCCIDGLAVAWSARLARHSARPGGQRHASVRRLCRRRPAVIGHPYGLGLRRRLPTRVFDPDEPESLRLRRAGRPAAAGSSRLVALVLVSLASLGVAGALSVAHRAAEDAGAHWDSCDPTRTPAPT
jgi:hypothetical protein